MVLDNSAAAEAARVLTSFVADLTDAVYSVVLQHGIGGSWIDLQLDVWKVLALSVAHNERSASRLPSAAEYLEWREAFLSELTDVAYRTTLKHGFQGPFLEIELDVYRALREVIERSQSSTGLRFIFGSGARAITDAVLARLEHESAPRAGRHCFQA